MPSSLHTEAGLAGLFRLCQPGPPPAAGKATLRTNAEQSPETEEKRQNKTKQKNINKQTKKTTRILALLG